MTCRRETVQSYPKMSDPRPRVHFAARGAFARELDARVDAYFEGLGEDRRDVPRMYLKSAIIFVWFVTSWAVLVFAAHNAFTAVAAALSLGFAGAASGMSVQHDANHGAYSSRPWVNRFFGCALDVMGVSSFIWKPKHNTFHHTFTNVEGVDYDLDFGSMARLSPEQPLRGYHRYQHVYLWFLYGFLLTKWVFYDDVQITRSHMVGVHKLAHMKRADWAKFVLAKLTFLSWGFIIPAFFHPIWQVLLFHFIASFTLGVTLGTVFQLAHCNDAADFPAACPKGGIDCDWTEHQIATTVDFGRNNAFATWFMGGLNFQVEHHLYPKICHVHYPALAKIVIEVCEKYGIRHRCHDTVWAAIVSHVRHTRKLGRAPAALPVAAAGQATSQAT